MSDTPTLDVLSVEQIASLRSDMLILGEAHLSAIFARTQSEVFHAAIRKLSARPSPEKQQVETSVSGDARPGAEAPTNVHDLGD